MTINPQLLPLIGRFAAACEHVSIDDDVAAAISKTLTVIGANMALSKDLEQAMTDLLKFHTQHFKNTEANTQQSALRVVK